MKKIKIDKIQIADMSLDRKMDVNGGGAVNQQQQLIWTVTVTVTIPLTGRTMDGWPGCYTEGCLSKNPGTQDSCGLCTTNRNC